jgi:aspergillopepsin I
VSLAGIHLPKQQVAFAETGAWRGDGITSGILGLGLRALTESYTKTGQAFTYDPIVSTMQKEGIPPVFALALSRNEKESFLSFGGIPDVQTDTFAATPIIKVSGYHDSIFG